MTNPLQNQRQALERAMRAGLELGLTTATLQGILFTKAIMGSTTLATEIPQAIAQIQRAGLEDSYQAALQEITLAYEEDLEHEKSVRAYQEMQHQKLEEELAIDSLLDKAFEQAIRGKLDLKLVQGKVLNLRQSNRWESLIQKNKTQRSAMKAKAEHANQPKPIPKPRPTRFLSAVSDAPQVGSRVMVEGQMVLITSLSEKQWEFNARQLENPNLVEFAGKMMTYVYYQLDTEVDLGTAGVASQD